MSTCEAIGHSVAATLYAYDQKHCTVVWVVSWGCNCVVLLQMCVCVLHSGEARVPLLWVYVVAKSVEILTHTS